MSRKVFISVLGTGFYLPCKYGNDQFTSSATRFIQEATLEYLQAECWHEADTILMLLTEGATSNNWSKDIRSRLNPRSKEEEPYTGLQQLLSQKQLSCQIETLYIPDGKNNDEMWQIFQLLYESLRNEDELYIDLTHSYRYLPMLVLVLSNYGRFLKNITIKHISYGNYESRDVETNVAALIDLLPLTQLQEWTYAAANLLRNGDAQTLKELCKRSLIPLLKDPEVRRSTPSLTILRGYVNALADITQAMKGCRAIELNQGEPFHKLFHLSQQLDQIVIQPMAPIIQKIETSFRRFAPTPDIMNGYQSAFWCFDHQLYQQSLTILHENIVSHLCHEASMDYQSGYARKVVSSALHIHSRQLPEDQWKVDSQEEADDIKRLLQIELLQQLSSTYLVTTTLRNDYNHAGIRKSPASTDTICRELEARLSKIRSMFFSEKSILINLSNHPYATWSTQQKQAALLYGEVKEIPFPVIDAQADEKSIESLACYYLEKIKTFGHPYSTVVHIMGEFNFTFALVKKLKEEGYTCIASTSKRISTPVSDGKKIVSFQFERFRCYD